MTEIATDSRYVIVPDGEGWLLIEAISLSQDGEHGTLLLPCMIPSRHLNYDELLRELYSCACPPPKPLDLDERVSTLNEYMTLDEVNEQWEAYWKTHGRPDWAP